MRRLAGRRLYHRRWKFIFLIFLSASSHVKVFKTTIFLRGLCESDSGLQCSSVAAASFEEYIPVCCCTLQCLFWGICEHCIFYIFSDYNSRRMIRPHIKDGVAWKPPSVQHLLRFKPCSRKETLASKPRTRFCIWHNFCCLIITHIWLYVAVNWICHWGRMVELGKPQQIPARFEHISKSGKMLTKLILRQNIACGIALRALHC